MAESFTPLETGFSILKYGDHYNLNYPVVENGEEMRKFLSFKTFDEAFNYYKETINGKTTGSV